MRNRQKALSISQSGYPYTATNGSAADNLPDRIERKKPCKPVGRIILVGMYLRTKNPWGGFTPWGVLFLLFICKISMTERLYLRYNRLFVVSTIYK